MKLLAALAFAMSLFGQQEAPFRLEPGEYRWIPFTVRQTPTEVVCRFHVVRGGPTAHAELLALSDFQSFNRGREHGSLAVTPTARAGGFRRTLEDRGEYAVVVMNDRNAQPAEVVLEVSTDLNPPTAVVTRELTQGRRLTVILVSFALFFTIVTWCGVRLVRAITKS